MPLTVMVDVLADLTLFYFLFVLKQIYAFYTLIFLLFEIWLETVI